jgi:hypothetical protein
MLAGCFDGVPGTLARGILISLADDSAQLPRVNSHCGRIRSVM